MKFLKLTREIFEKCDVFCSTEYLRYKKEPQYKTFCGGLVSITLICTLLVIFSNKVMNTLNMLSITSSTSTQADDDPTPIIVSTKGQARRSFMFGVEVWHHNLNEGIRYFDIELYNMIYRYGDPTDETIQYPLQPCTPDHWKGYPVIQSKFESLHMNYWLCPPKDIDFAIQGKYSSMTMKSIEVYVNKCTNNSYNQQRCADQNELNAFFEDNTQKIYFTIYFTNPRINPDQADFLTYYMNDENYMIFSKTGGEQAQIMMDGFSIITDNSISPLSDFSEDEGSVVQKNAIKNRFQISADNNNYCAFYIFKSPNTIEIIRSYEKLDQILAYIGGLFGTLVMCMFIVRVYNGYSFEIQLGGVLYQHDEHKDGFKKYNFWQFLTQGLYNLLKLFGGGKCLTRAKNYQRCRTELLKQLDVLYLLKRVSFLERAINVILDEHQIKAIHLLKKLSLQDARRHRKHFELQQQPFKSQNSQKASKDDNPPAANNNNNKIIIRSNQVANQDIFNFSAHEYPYPQSQSTIKQPPHEQNQNDDNESSSSDGSVDETVTNNQKNTMEQLIRLKNQKEVSSISNRIYQNLSDFVKKRIDNLNPLPKQQTPHSHNHEDSNNLHNNDLKLRRSETPKVQELSLVKLLKPLDQEEVQSNDFHFLDVQQT